MAEPSLTLVRRMPASAHTTYFAFIDPTLIEQWAVEPGTLGKIEVDPRVGGSLRLESAEGNVTAFYMELNPGRRIMLGWTGASGAQSTVAVDLRSVLPDVTQLTLTHDRLPTSEREVTDLAWNGRLDRLEAFLARITG